MRDPDLTTLRLFVTVCDTRNITRAATRHAIVGSAVSKRLAALEHTVGTPLLLRRRHGVEPTAAGETLLEHARTLLANADSLARDMGAYASGVRGQVRVLATVSVLAESLADDIAAFLQVPAHRDIQISIEERISPEVAHGIRTGAASLGICWNAADLSELQTRPYRSDQLAIVAHPSHALARHTHLAFAQALAYEHVSLPVNSAVQVMLQRAAAALGQPLVHRVIVSHFEAALRVVRANLAISVVPAEVAQPYAIAHGLHVIPLTDTWAQRQFAICCRDEATLSPPARLLLGHLSGLDAQPGTPAGRKN